MNSHIPPDDSRAPLWRPIPPANAVADAVRALNTILHQLSGPKALAALNAGDACSQVDVNVWGPAWEGARNFRDHFLLTLARVTRAQWRADVTRVLDELPQSLQEAAIQKALDERLRITLDFAFRFLTPRHVCFLGDALMLAFEADIPTGELAKELAESASRTRHRTPQMLDALVLGASGMHRYQAERVMSLTGAGANKLPSENGGDK